MHDIKKVKALLEQKFKSKEDLVHSAIIEKARALMRETAGTRGSNQDTPPRKGKHVAGGMSTHPQGLKAAHSSREGKIKKAAQPKIAWGGK